MTSEPEIEPSRPLPVPVAGIDALIERAYALFGWRLPLFCAVAHWVMVLSFHVMLVAQVGRIEGIGRHSELIWLARIMAGLLVAIVAGSVASLRVTRELGTLLDTPGEDAAQHALTLVQRLPVRLIGVNFVAGVVVSLPVTVVSTAVAVHITPSLGVLLALGGLGAMLLVSISSWAWYRLVMMPMLRDISERVGARVPGYSGPGLSTALLIAIPGLAYGVGVGAVIVAAPSHTASSTVIERFSVGFGLALPLLLPIALLLAHASVQPLGALIDASKRIEAADYTTHVPVLPGREFDALGETLNAAMDGLAERQRLTADNDALLEEVQASRARIVAAGDAERRRIERNIHDGAQQRLVALALELRMLEDEAAASSEPRLKELAHDAITNLKAALDELRELARGLHPAVLATDGIRPALEQVAARSSIPVHLDVSAERFAPVIESTAYFVACEALANVAKHARATSASVVISVHSGVLRLSVADDGVGGADMSRGSGLAGLADRLAAMSGTLLITSRSTGTTLIAELPIAGPSVDEAAAMDSR